jgi:hypothetical protein
MTTRVRPLLILVLVFCSGLAVSVQWNRFDDHDQQRALMIVRMARFGDKTSSRLDKWLVAHRVQPDWRWSSSPPALFSGVVPIRLDVKSQGNDEAFHFTVNPKTRAIEGADADASALLLQVREWAAHL